MMELIKRDLRAGVKADYILFDTWFSAPVQLIDIRLLGLDAIAMIKKSSNRTTPLVTTCGKALHRLQISLIPWNSMQDMQMEIDILKETIDELKKDPGANMESLKTERR